MYSILKVRQKPLIIIGSWDSRNPDKENKRISADFEQEMRELVEILGQIIGSF